mmetsp:Transcript_60249/g.136222  ORF Transcript_60249/g.136222 Transcript_60249/m.136222 type:complete len:253 (-) Transcript_60249:544-1302(-)
MATQSEVTSATTSTASADTTRGQLLTLSLSLSSFSAAFDPPIGGPSASSDLTCSRLLVAPASSALFAATPPFASKSASCSASCSAKLAYTSCTVLSSTFASVRSIKSVNSYSSAPSSSMDGTPPPPSSIKRSASSASSSPEKSLVSGSGGVEFSPLPRVALGWAPVSSRSSLKRRHISAALRRFPFRAREPTASVSVVVSMRRRNMDTATALRPELKATNERGMYTVASARPRVVTGYTSPYPIVVPVAVAK